MDIHEEILADRESGARRLVAEYKDRLYSAALMMCGNEHEAEELVFRTFAQAVNKIAKYRPDGSFFGWLFAILANFRKMDLRRKACRVLLFFTDELPEKSDTKPDAGETLSAAGDAERVRRAVSTLPEVLRAAVILRYFEDLPTPEISRILKIPEGTVRSRLHNAKALLRDRLKAVVV